MKKAGLIGLGTITKRYAEGLKHSSFLSLCAVSDLNAQAVSREVFREYPFYEDYGKMLREESLDLVIISTPPESHFDIAMSCFEQGVGVIIEKPVVLCLEQFDALCKTAREKGLLFKTLFHWLGGIELRRFAKEYDIRQIKQIRARVLDPYSEDGQTILEDRRPLMGAWIDSGVNMLSMIKLWLPFQQVEFLGSQTRRCKDTGMPLFVDVSLMIDGIPVNLQVDWTTHQNRKESTITLADRTIHIHHSDQCIIDGDNRIPCGRKERLDEHYFTLFTEMDSSPNENFSKAVHQLLLEVNQKL